MTPAAEPKPRRRCEAADAGRRLPLAAGRLAGLRRRRDARQTLVSGAVINLGVGSGSGSGLGLVLALGLGSGLDSGFRVRVRVTTRIRLDDAAQTDAAKRQPRGKG